MTITEAIDSLKAHASATHLEGMARFGIVSANALGVKIPDVRKLAKQVKADHQLALELWASGIHEARILASMVADAKQVTPILMDEWTHDFHSWDVCDQVCGNLFIKTPFAMEKALEYSQHKDEFVKRTGFSLMAYCAVHLKKADDTLFLQFLPVIEREAWDERNFVKKAVNWALRQIGKRSALLCHAAIQTADRILRQDSNAARWIARDALRELESKLN